MNTPFAHIAGMPVEESIATLGPGLLATAAWAWAAVRSRISR
jgi:hypothetical protein